MTDKKPKGAQNPPSDHGSEDVVGAKAKVNPQAVGAVLSGNDHEAKPRSDEQEAAATEKYMLEQAPLDDRVEGKPLRDPDDEDDTNN